MNGAWLNIGGNMKNKFLLNLMYFMALTLVMGIGVVIADNVGTLTTFQPGTVARSSEVNDNFSTIANSVNDNYARLPIMWAQTDVDLNERIFAVNSPPSEINSLAINAPSSGFLVISGSVVMSNLQPGTVDYFMTPYLDGKAVPTQTHPVPGDNDYVAAYRASSTGTPGSMFSLSYTVTIPIAAGVYTVSQTAGPAVTSLEKFWFNKNYLTVVFYPDAQGALNYTVDEPL